MSTPDNATARNPAKKKRDRSPREPNPTQQLLTGTQGERVYGIPRRTLYDLFVTGKLPAVRFTSERRSRRGGRLWYRREDIEALIERSIEVSR